MNTSIKAPRTDKIQLSDSEFQALHTLLMSGRARYEFRYQALELKNVERNRKKTTLFWHTEDAESEARSWLELVEAAENAGEMSASHRFFMRVFAIERIHEARWLEGLYNEDLADLTAQMDEIRQREGLGEDECWSRGEGPADWSELNNQYELILDIKFENTLREYDLKDIADLYHTDRNAFDALREEGRRFVFEDIPELEKLSALQHQYETEATICAQGKAFHAAAAMIGSAMETALLIVCLNYRDNAIEARNLLPEQIRPKFTNPRSWNFNQLVMIVDKAGWLPDIVVEDDILSSYRLTNLVRQLRNMLHPARHLSDRSVLDVERQYTNAQAAYTLLKQHLVKAWTG